MENSFQKNIKDLAINNGEWLIERSNFLTLELLEQQISQLPYSGTGLKKDEIIENTQFPPFLQVFYYLIYQYKSIPNQELLFSEYVKWLNPDTLTETQFSYQDKQYSIEGLKARILRTYPSFVRDVHFYYFLLESGEFENVKYSMYADYYEGIDILISKNNITYGISILVNTARSAAYKKLKEKRHNYKNVKEIKLQVDFSDLDQNGNFYLLGKKQLLYLLQEINTKY